MSAEFSHFELELVQPEFDSKLTDALIELEHLRRLRLYGTTQPWIFFQLKEIFHLCESVGSARIEGNRTTISEYIEQKIEHTERSQDRFSEIANVERAMSFIEETIEVGSPITHMFIRELHQITVSDLVREGDRTPGGYRSWNVEISKSSHKPPEHHLVMGYMDELVRFINEPAAGKYELIKTAIAHHRFAWIHPFGNGNGRVVRLLTYALLIKYGFNVKDGKLLNPTAVFCNDREQYYQMLAVADRGTKESLLNWCEYVLVGIKDEISKVSRLLDHDYLSHNILLPAINDGRDRGFLNKVEAGVLKLGIEKQSFKAGDLDGPVSGLNTRQRTHLIAKLKEAGFIRPLKPEGREYYVNFNNNFLMRCLVKMLERENFIPPLG